MNRIISRTALLQSGICIIGLFALGWFALTFRSYQPAAQTLPVRVAINVNNHSLPITIGVPFSESTTLFDAAKLGVTDTSGNPLPSQMRVLSRWRGPANDASKPVKWLLVDFKPAATGNHFLTTASRVNIKPLSITDAGNGLRISNSQLEVEFSKQGDGLIKSFKLDANETLRDPMNIRMDLPRRALITRIGSVVGLSPDTIIVNDASLFKPGDTVRFEHVDTLKWDAAAGTARLVTNDQTLAGGRRYRIDEGTPRQEEIEISSATPGDLRAATTLKFAHSPGSTIRDLNVEQEEATIKSVSGQTVQFNSPLKFSHTGGEKIFVPNSGNQTVTASVERAAVEDSNALRAVIRQDGSFRSGSGKLPQTVAFALRYYIYADQPFIRVRLRIMNNGTYGFGPSRSQIGPFMQHVILRSLSVSIPTTSAGSGEIKVLSLGEATARIAKSEGSASVSAGRLEIAVPEFAENYPKLLRGNNNGVQFDILPDLGGDYVFDGSRAKTTDLYLGRNAAKAVAITNSLNASLDPAYIAKTGAVRPIFVEKRDWAAEFSRDPRLAEAAIRVEKMFASGYAAEASEAAGAIPQVSIFEYRQRGENGEMFGWRNFGDLAWGDGYANVHYDLPFILLREFLRTGDPRAFQLGSEMARYRADWGHYRTDDFIDRERVWNLKGFAFYEKGDHGSFREPVPTHSWIEGMWLYWALTGDEAVRESAIEGAEAFARMNPTFGNSLGWNEPRFLGWPTLGLVVAYRYTGDIKYLNRARAYVNLFLQTDENFGRKGYYINKGPNMIEAVQPWAWSYALLGVIEYWRDTRDKRAADFIVRVADWLIGKGSKNPPLKPAQTLSDGTYLPIGVSYFWTPDKIAEDRSLALAGLSLPIITTAARITNRADLWASAEELYRDYAFYRDFNEGKPVVPSSRAVINFRSLLFAASVTKVYGQMGLTVSDFLPDIVASEKSSRGNKQSERLTGKKSGKSSEKTTISTPPPAIIDADPPPSADTGQMANVVNVALSRPAMASSSRAWPDVVGAASAANDGQRVALGRASAWHSEIGSGQLEWWQVDLGKSYQIGSIEVIFREDVDQATTRRNFEVRGSNDLNFNSSTVLGSQGEDIVPFTKGWRVNVKGDEGFRFVRVQKTKIDRDALGQSFFNLLEVKIFASMTPPTPPPPQAKPSSSKSVPIDNLPPRRIVIGQTLSIPLSRFDERGQPLQLYALNMPPNAMLDTETGYFRFTPTSDQTGNIYQITFRAINDQVDKSARLDVAVIIDGSPQVKLIEPTVNSRLTVNNSTLISWSSIHPTRITRCQIRLSTDGGVSYPKVIADVSGSSTQYQWLIPKDFPVVNQPLIRLMVQCRDLMNRVGIDFTKQDLPVHAN